MASNAKFSLKGQGGQWDRVQKANDIFNILEKFAGYGFNKSHSAAYGIISYQTAYLKANHPVDFMAGVLACELGNSEKLAHFWENVMDGHFCADVNESGKTSPLWSGRLKNLAPSFRTFCGKGCGGCGWEMYC